MGWRRRPGYSMSMSSHDIEWKERLMPARAVHVPEFVFSFLASCAMQGEFLRRKTMLLIWLAECSIFWTPGVCTCTNDVAALSCQRATDAF